VSLERSGRAVGSVPLPGGFCIQCHIGVAVLSRGTVLLGGSPPRLVRLTPAGAAAAGLLFAGAAVADAGPGAGMLARRLVDGGLAEPCPPAGAGPTPAEVTVAIPVRDRARDLAALLAALRPAPRRGMAVLVVDDGSTDGSGDVARAAGARLVRHEVARGPAAARSTALAAAATPLVAFLDSDVLPTPGWLEKLLPHLADPAVAAVAPRVASRPGPSPRDRYEHARSPLDLGPAPGPVRPGSRLSYVPAAALLLRRDLPGGVVGFDPALRYGEDVDLVWRLVAAGWTVRYEPAATVTHRPRPSWPAWAAQRAGYGSSAAALAVRHPGPLRPLAGSAGTLAAWGLAAAGAPALGAAVTGYATARLAGRFAGVPGAPGIAASLVARGHRYAAESLADGMRRLWLPLAPAVVASGRPGRRLVLAALLAPVARDWWRERPELGLASYAALRLADDAAYCAGVWWGCARERTLLPVLPALRRSA
jgi:mycofactocin glycosyltransferase